MTKRIKHVSELPTWFQLNKYEFATNLDALGWYEQFFVRGTFLYHARDMRENHEVFPDDFKQAMQASREKPHTIIESDQRLANYCTMVSSCPLITLKKNSTKGLMTIKSITMRDYIGFKFFLRPERIKYIEDWYNMPDSKKQIYPKDAPWFNEPISNSFTAQFGNSLDTVNIDLRSPDSFLIESFKNYLAEKRKTIAAFTKKHLRESDFNHWITLAILPYLDLIIWSIETETHIPNRVLADALYPHGEKGEETIRKTTSHLAEALLDNENIYKLIQQATADVLAKNTA